MKIKIGIGYDIHPLVTGRKLFLGGVEIPYPKGLGGHSDGDCLIHAVIDALLGALGEGDIGQFFPDNDPAFKNIRSTDLLVEIAKKLKHTKAEILHIDSIIIAEQPKLSVHISHMKNILCPILGLSIQDLGIKAKTNEGQGFVGKGGAIAAWATALLGFK